MRRIERADLGNGVEPRPRKVDNNSRQTDHSLFSRFEKSFLKSVCLALNTIDQDANDILTIHPALFEYMLWGILPRIGRGEELVPVTTHRLKTATTPESGTTLHDFVQLTDFHDTPQENPHLINLFLAVVTTQKHTRLHGNKNWLVYIMYYACCGRPGNDAQTHKNVALQFHFIM